MQEFDKVIIKICEKLVQSFGKSRHLIQGSIIVDNQFYNIYYFNLSRYFNLSTYYI